ncbi:MAG: hypothetical protein EZS28_015109 [Streblomastix strix]|uniref:Uncharacterized protein n=1 Tax=Streblomastix strix TaxID=222440 RepID=A0A5J4W456_9EUKA|nr:MAG: hypothetical protein EZS28_015109 [Streblomastix strix]
MPDDEEYEEDQDKRGKQKKDKKNNQEASLNLADQYDTFAYKSYKLDNIYTQVSSIVISSYFPIVTVQQSGSKDNDKTQSILLIILQISEYLGISYRFNVSEASIITTNVVRLSPEQRQKIVDDIQNTIEQWEQRASGLLTNILTEIDQEDYIASIEYALSKQIEYHQSYDPSSVQNDSLSSSSQKQILPPPSQSSSFGLQSLFQTDSKVTPHPQLQ